MAKIRFATNVPYEHHVLDGHIQSAKARGLPMVAKQEPHEGKLAVVGGGPSIKNHLDDLRSWPGDIWAINGACRWLRAAGVESTFLTTDPTPGIAEVAKGARNALVASRCHPSVFDALEDAAVRLFHVSNDDVGGFWASVSTVMVTFDLATHLGFREIHFFGCEGSYETTTHTYMDDPQTFRFVVACNGGEYLTLPELYLQTVQLAEVLRNFPVSFRERSGGLLGAMVRNPEHDIVKVSRALLAGCEFKEAA